MLIRNMSLRILFTNNIRYGMKHFTQAERLVVAKKITLKPWNSVAYCTNQNQPNQSSVILRDLTDRRLIAPLRTGQERLRNKFNAIYKSYEDYSLTSDVRQAHQHVELIQEELRIAQERRRDLSKELSNIRHELQLIYADLANCKKGEPRYLEIVRKEYETHHLEQQKLIEFELQDKTERDLFMHLQAAVKTSHEKEKMHTNSAKYWSIVGSLLGALLGICGTLFSFYNRNNTITNMLDQVKTDFVTLQKQTKASNDYMKELLDLNHKMYDKQLLSDPKESWSSWTWSWTSWAGRKIGVVYIYKWFHKSD